MREVATERLMGSSRVDAGRPAESLGQIISILGARRRDLRALAGDRLRRLDARAVAAADRHVEMEARLASVEGHLEQLDQARQAHTLRTARRQERIARLKQQVEILRARAGARDPGAESRPDPRVHTPELQAAARARMYQLGTALMYVGGLAVLWVVLLELGLALGLR